MRIAVFESNESCAKQINETLYTAGHETLIVWPLCKEALWAIRSFIPDLVLFDNGFCGPLSGEDFLEELSFEDWRLISTGPTPSSYCRKHWPDKHGLILPNSGANASLLEVIKR